MSAEQEVDEFEVLARQRVGTVLRDRYRIEGLLGMGGMASVYWGSHRNGNRVAIKVLHPDLSKSREVCARFLKEGYVANAVGHPGAVRVLDDDTSPDGAPFLVMELLEGQTVDARHVEAGRALPLAEVAKIAHDVLDVLTMAHEKTIVHRDLKPENLFISKSGQIKVLDFGIARMRDGIGTSWTRSGHAMGTPAFMPPEQAMGLTREIDGRTDLWAVGATMFTLLTGHFVHQAETLQQLLIFAATQPARSIRSVSPDLAPPFAAVIDRALSYEGARRYPDAPSMRAAIEEAYRATFGTALAASIAPKTVELKHAAPRGAETHLSASPVLNTKQAQLAAPTAHVDSTAVAVRPVAVAATVDATVLPQIHHLKTVDATVGPATEFASPITERTSATVVTLPPATEMSPPLAFDAQQASIPVGGTAPGLDVRMASTTAGLSSSRMTTGAHPPVDLAPDVMPDGVPVPRSRFTMIAAVLVGALLIGGLLAGGAVKLLGGSSDGQAIVAAPPPAVTQPPPIVATAIPASAPAAPAASVATEPAPAAAPATKRPQPAPVTPLSPARTAVPVVVPVAPAPNCSPPYFIDPADGHRIPKKECLGR